MSDFGGRRIRMSTPASAAPSPTPAAGNTSPVAGSGTAICKITDSRMTEASGIVATAGGYLVINDGNTNQSREKIFTLDKNCKITSQVSYPRPAIDPEDLAMAKDGTVWVADIGDNSPASGGDNQRRSTIALWSIAPGSKTPVIHRLAYPDGKARDAETLLMSPNGTPVIVTKEPAGEVYVPAGALQSDNKEGVKLKKVGTFTPEKTGTPNPLLFIGSALITGGAVSADGTKAVVRTMSDAYEFDVSGGDVAAAVTSGKYRITPLPNEPQGEGISYAPDGKSFVTCSDQTGPSTLLRYTPAKANPGKPAAGAQVPSPTADKRSFLSKLTLQDLTYMVAAVGVLGLLLVVGGILGIRNSRKRRRRYSGPAGPIRLDDPDGPIGGPSGGPSSGSGQGGPGQSGPGRSGPGRGGDGGGRVYGRPPGGPGEPPPGPAAPKSGPPRGRVYGAGDGGGASAKAPYVRGYDDAGDYERRGYEDQYRRP